MTIKLDSPLALDRIDKLLTVMQVFPGLSRSKLLIKAQEVAFPDMSRAIWNISNLLGPLLRHMDATNLIDITDEGYFIHTIDPKRKKFWTNKSKSKPTVYAWDAPIAILARRMEEARQRELVRERAAHAREAKAEKRRAKKHELVRLWMRRTWKVTGRSSLTLHK
jgi:hypothetical protein